MKLKDFLFYSSIAAILVILLTGIFIYTQKPKSTWPPPNVVNDGGTWTIVNELVILNSGQDVKSLVNEFGGEITISVPETDTYQVRFPVSSLAELDAIADKLRKKENGIKVVHVFVIPPPEPGSDQ